MAVGGIELMGQHLLKQPSIEFVLGVWRGWHNGKRPAVNLWQQQNGRHQRHHNN